MFSARFYGSTVCSVLLSEREWHELKAHAKRDPSCLITGCCGELCSPRVSRLGTKHFYHRPQGSSGPPCAVGGESTEHLLLKEEVVLRARQLGWTARTEVTSVDGTWIADTLLERGAVRIAVEIQLSRQTYSRYLDRQRRYAAQGVRGLWLFRYGMHELSEERWELPAFPVQVEKERRKGIVSVRQNNSISEISLPEFLSAALNGKLQYVEGVDIFPARCADARCHATMTMWIGLGERLETSLQATRLTAGDFDRQRVLDFLDEESLSPLWPLVGQRVIGSISIFVCPSCGSAQNLPDRHISEARNSGSLVQLRRRSYEHGAWEISSGEEERNSDRALR